MIEISLPDVSAWPPWVWAVLVYLACFAVARVTGGTDGPFLMTPHAGNPPLVVQLAFLPLILGSAAGWVVLWVFTPGLLPAPWTDD